MADNDNNENGLGPEENGGAQPPETEGSQLEPEDGTATEPAPEETDPTPEENVEKDVEKDDEKDDEKDPVSRWGNIPRNCALLLFGIIGIVIFFAFRGCEKEIKAPLPPDCVLLVSAKDENETTYAKRVRWCVENKGMKRSDFKPFTAIPTEKRDVISASSNPSLSQPSEEVTEEEAYRAEHPGEALDGTDETQIDIEVVCAPVDCSGLPPESEERCKAINDGLCEK